MSTMTVTTEDIADFYSLEAEHLDRADVSGWLGLLTEDVDYRVPIRVVREKAAEPVESDFSHRGHFMWENYGTLRTRVLRLESEFAWAEQPPTRTRRLVTNIRRRDLLGGDPEHDVRVLSNFAIYCYRGDSPEPFVLTGERDDLLRVVGEDLRLARRVVYLDTNVLGTHALSIFL